MIKKQIRNMFKKHDMFAEDRDHIKALKFSLKRKLKMGYISQEKYEAKLTKISVKAVKLKEIRTEYWSSKKAR